MKTRILTLTVLLLLLCAGCQQTAADPYVTPDFASLTDITMDYAIHVPEGKTVSFYVERWQDAKQVDRALLASYTEDMAPIQFQIIDQDDQRTYVHLKKMDNVLESVGYVEVPQPQGAVAWCWLTEEEWKQLFQSEETREIILYACVVGEEDSPVSMTDCSILLEDPTCLEYYAELQIIRAVLEE